MVEGKRLFKKLKRRCREELGQDMSHSGLKLKVQHYGAVQPHMVIPRTSLGSQTTHTDCYCAWEMQPAKAHHSSLADFDCKI